MTTASAHCSLGVNAQFHENSRNFPSKSESSSVNFHSNGEFFKISLKPSLGSSICSKVCYSHVRHFCYYLYSHFRIDLHQQFQVVGYPFRIACNLFLLIILIVFICLFLMLNSHWGWVKYDN